MAQLQAKLFTNEDEFKINETTFDLPGEVNIEELNILVNKLLKEKWDSCSQEEEKENTEFRSVLFDFLVEDEFLRGPLYQHVENKGLSTESVIQIEYVAKQDGPEAEEKYEADDWISGIDCTKNFILTGTYDSKISIWNLDDSSQVVHGTAHTEPVKSVAWVTSDETMPLYLVSTSQDQSAIMWKWQRSDESIKPLFCCRGHTKSVDCVSVHPQGEVFCTGSWDCSIKVWSAAATPQDDTKELEDFQKSKNKKKRQRIEQRGVTRVPKTTLAGHSEAVSDVVWLSSTDICSVSWDHTIRVWDVSEQKEKTKLRGAKVFLACDYSQKNNLLATGNSDRHIRIWDPRGKGEIFSDASLIKCNLTSHNGWVTCVRWSPSKEHQLVSGSLDMAVKLWDIRSPKTPLYDLDAHEDKVMCLDWSNEQTILSGGADKNLYRFKYRA